METPTKLTAKDYESSREIRWCPGCGDYSILKQTQMVFADLGLEKHNTVFVSGIGCSSRFPYYMETYGMHSIHGRATAIASGLKAARPDLDVWIITGDGDSLSIGGNHLIHLLRRNFNVQILLFNNEIYGLTKGQYSPTSPLGVQTKSTPMGSIDHPFNPVALALGAEATFVARTIDREPRQLKEILKAAHAHKGSAFVEIYQNCNVFNDGAFDTFTSKDTRHLHNLYLTQGDPLLFGEHNELGIKLDGFTPKVVSLNEGYSTADVWIHDANDAIKATILSRMFDNPEKSGLPRPFGIFYQQNRPVYEEMMAEQIVLATDAKGKGSLEELLKGKHSYKVT
jgi:2-oxoglutarate ferredoxin oxidoreductase subunit beta